MLLLTNLPRHIPTPRTRPALLILLAAAFALAAAFLPGLATDPPPAAEAAHLTASSISITSNSTGGSYYTGDVISVQVVFSNCVQSVSGGFLEIRIGSNTRSTGAPTGTGSNTLTYSYTVTGQDEDSDGITVATNALNGSHMSQTGNCSASGNHGTIPTLPNTLTSAQYDHRVNVNFLDFDQDNDGLIEIFTPGLTGLRRLRAIEADPDGNGIPVELDDFTGSEVAAFNTAFTNRQSVATATSGIMGCSTPAGAARACIGYELSTDLTFDLNDDGEVTMAGDGLSARLINFRPIGLQFGHRWTTTFEGNGYTISYLRPTAAQSDIALFSRVDSGGHIRNLGLDNYYMSNNLSGAEQGALVGSLQTGATVSNCWAAGTVTNTQTGPGGSGSDNKIGGLVGQLSGGTIRNSYADVAASAHDNNFNTFTGGLVGYMISGTIQGSYAAGAVAAGGGQAGTDRAGVGGLVGGQASGAITASYATGAVTGSNGAVVGGLVGIQTGGSITASYARGAVATSANGISAGLVANPGTVVRIGGQLASGAGTITNSYWDTDTSGIAANAASQRGIGLATAALQAPTDYTGIYRDWNVNVGGADALRDDPWHFDLAHTAAGEYPVLKFARTLTQVYDQIGVAAPTTPVDYADGDDLINVSNLTQLNAIRFDLDGSGADGLTAGRHGLVAGTPAHTYYHLAFPGATDATAGIGCTSGAGMCDGYELASDLDFANTGWAQSNGWVPIGPGGGADANASSYRAVFHGNGHTISNLTITTEVFRVGLFGRLYQARVEQLGLLQVNFTITKAAIGWVQTGALVGDNAQSTIRSTYATGRINATAGTGSSQLVAGGLVGTLAPGSATIPSQIVASWADVDLITNSPASAGSIGADRAGGLVGDVATTANGAPSIIAAYAAGDVTVNTAAGSNVRCNAGGLAGRVAVSSIIASYSIGTPTCNVASGSTGATGGLRGAVVGSPTITNSYWDSDATGISAAHATEPDGAPKTTSELQTPTMYAAPDFANWNVNTDGDTGTGTPTVGGDDPWDFGTATQYPILKYNYNDFGQQMQRTSDHDSDGDGLLQVDTLAKLDAIRHDLTGAGDTTTMDASARTAYRAAFPNHARCAPNPCTGYELTADLDFDTAGDDDIADAPYANWTPIGVDAAGAATPYSGAFDGNNHTISNLFIDLTTSTDDGGSYVGLFGDLSGAVRDVGLVNPSITNTRTGGGSFAQTGALAGSSVGSGSISGVSVRGGAVTHTGAASSPIVGCLVGYAAGPISDSWASCAVTGAATSTSAFAAMSIGGLVGWSQTNGTVTNSHATGAVTITNATTTTVSAGGLVGNADNDIISSYAAGNVTDHGSNPVSNVGGLVGTAVDLSIRTSFATGAVSANTARNVGGLIGFANLGSSQVIAAGYATGSVSRTSAAGSTEVYVGGLIGRLSADTGTAEVTATYATGAVVKTAAGPGTGAAGGLVGGSVGTESMAVKHSYWTNAQTASAGSAATTLPKTAAELQTPATYAGIYANWNLDLDGDTTTGDAAGNDDPWHFGASNQYPILKYGHNAASYAIQLGLTNVDYDADDDNLIDVTNLHQLHAIRYDADGNGMVAAGDTDAYALAYPAAVTGMGCPDPVNGCIGYELLNDLDFDTAGSDRTADFPYANWTPLPQYTATFDGGGHTIANLNVDIASSPAGLFARLNGASGVIRSLGLIDPTIRSRATSGFNNIGALVGENNGGARIYAVYVSGGSVTSTAPDAVVGGLAGRNTGSSIIASYAISTPVAVSGNGIFFRAGGLVGGNYSGSTIRASWAASPVDNTAQDSGATTRGGLVGYTAGALDYSYHDGGIASGTAGGTSQTNLLLVSTDRYTDIYQFWNVDVDGDAATGDAAGNDNPWDFGGPLQYPLLTYGFGETAIARQRANLTFTDYDTDNDNLIEVDSLAKLNAIRWDLNGDGAVSDSDQTNYAAVYPRPLAGMGCAAACTGYELTADLDFDTGTAGDRTDDLYYNGGAGWSPIGGQYSATFEGNGRTISNLHINRSTSGSDDWVGLFSGLLGPGGVIRSVGLLNPNITAATPTSNDVTYAGALVGNSEGGGRIYAAYVSGGSVATTSDDDIVGGLVGRNNGANTSIIASYALNTMVTASGNFDAAGGLVGGNYSGAAVTASYAASVVSNTGGGSDTGGLAGVNSTAAINDSHYDNDLTAAAGGGGSGQTTSALQTPATYGAASGDAYYQWNVNVDGDANTGDAAGNDDPWDFAANYQYPILKYGFTTPAARAAQLDPQDPTVTRIAPPANVDRIRQTGAYAYLLEVDSPVTMVALPTTLFTTTQSAATVAAPTTDTAGASVGGDDGDVVTLGPGETPTVAVIRITSPNGRSTLDYTLTIQRIFCPKASLTGPSDVVGEGGIAEFTVLICGPTAEDVVVSWRAEGAAGGGAAAADSADLSGLSLPSTGTVTVPAGHDATAVISFPIADDADAEGSESFTVTLTGAAGGTERYDDDAPATATIALSDPTLNLRAPQGTGAGESGNGAGSDTPLTASSRLIITEGAANAYTMQLESPPGESVTVVIHSNHDGITTTPDRVTFTNGNYNTPQRVTVNAAQDGDDNNESATLTHILTDADGGLIEIIDQLPLFVADTDPPEDDDIC